MSNRNRKATGAEMAHARRIIRRAFPGLEPEFGGHGHYDLLDDALAILDELRIDRAAWVGLSTGGFVAVRAALRVPERVRAIVVADASAAAWPGPICERFVERRVRG